MLTTIADPSDVDALALTWSPAVPQKHDRPTVITYAELLAMDAPEPEMLIQGIVPLRGASLLVGPPKSGKTLLAMQMAIAVASGVPLFSKYEILRPGPALLVEQDDPAASASVKSILLHSPEARKDLHLPFHLVPRVEFDFGDQFVEWLGGEIERKGLRLCILDSYTALRGARSRGGDIVKQEQSDLSQMDGLAKRTDTAILILHYNSKGSASLDWSQQSAGTYAMTAATEAQISISRFSDLDTAASERLVRVRGRHSEDLEMLLRFQKETLNFGHVMEGAAAALFPMIQQLQTAFGEAAFGIKTLSHETGVSRATAQRQIDRLLRSGAITRRSYGEYVLADLLT